MQHGKGWRLTGFLLFCALMAPFVAQAATPTIASVNGNMTNGSTITVNGSNLVSENTASWISFFQSHPSASNFAGASPSADGYGAIGPKGGTYVTNKTLLGNQSMYFPVSGASTGATNMLANYNAINTGGGDSQDLWFRFYVAWNSANNLWPNDHIKMIDCQGSGSQWYLQPANTTGSSLPSQMNGTWDATSHTVPIPSGTLQNNRWYCIEMHWKTTSPYQYQAWMDGVQIFNATPSTPGSLSYILFGVINAWNTSSSFSLGHWWDGFAVSKSRIYPASTIQVGNSPTYGQGNEQYQQPIALNDTQVQFVLNTSNVGSGPYYVWITNNGQVRSAGYTLASSGGAEPTGPSVPASLKATVASSSEIDLSWSASTDSTGVAGYYVYRNGAQIATTPNTSYKNTSLSADTTYSYTVAAYDAAGNVSAQCAAVSATTSNSGTTDTQPPTVPTGLAATVVSATQINLTWKASTDNVGVTGYNVYRNGSLAGTSTKTSFSDTGLTASTTYKYTVAAYDAAGNVSGQCTAVSATTQAKTTTDTTPPTVPTNLKATAASSSTISLTWTASTDNVGVAGYTIYRNATKVGTSTATSYSDTGLAASTAYSYTVSAYDAAGNQSGQSAAASATTSAGSGSTLLFEEDFNDSNLAGRGWYDNTNLVITTAQHITGATASAQFEFQKGATQPTSGGSIRHLFTPTNTLYVSYYIKHSTNWVGSGVNYDPHMIYAMTNLASAYNGLAFTNLTLYLEENAGTPRVLIQDGENIDQSKINVNLVGTTENRALAGCNGNSDAYPGGCYNAGPYYNNDKIWPANGVYFQSTPGTYYMGDWHFVEALITMNSIQNGKGVADGSIQYWYDGTLIMNYPNVMFRTGEHSTMQFNQLVIAPYIGVGSPVDQTFWIDKLKVATGR